MYYVNGNACNTIEDAEEVVQLYQAAGVAVDIITEQEYFEDLELAHHVGHIIVATICKESAKNSGAYRCQTCNTHLGYF